MASEEVVNAAYRRYRQLIETDTKLAKLRQMITSGNSTMEAMQKYSTRAGELGAQAIEEYAGKADFGELADAIMKLDHEYVSNASAKALKPVSGNLNPSLADYNPNDTAQIVSRLSDGDDAADGVASLRNSFIQQSQKVADEAERRTAEFMSNSGVEVLVTREYDDIGVHTTDKGGGDVCQWCLDRCGTDVPYQEAYEMGMFERHPGCGCIITYRKPNGVTYRQGKGDWETNNWNTLQEQDERDKRVERAKAGDNIGSSLKTPRQREFEATLTEVGPDNIHEAILQDPQVLADYTPSSLKKAFEDHDVKVLDYLGQGDYKKVRFKDGGGWRANFGGDGTFRYHPADRSHHGGAYYRLHKQGINKWFTLDGVEFDGRNGGTI